MLRHAYGFLERQEKATFGLGFKLIKTRNHDTAVLNRGLAARAGSVANANIVNKTIEWYVPHYTATIKQQGLKFKLILAKTPSELKVCFYEIWK